MRAAAAADQNERSNVYALIMNEFWLIVSMGVAKGVMGMNPPLAIRKKLECGPMPNVMVALPNIGGALCSTPQSLADAHFWSTVR